MALDCRGVKTEAFLELQEKVKGDIYLASDSLNSFKRLLASQSLGSKFHLISILDQLSKLGLDAKKRGHQKCNFFDACFAMP
jgi:hypothetical protein